MFGMKLSYGKQAMSREVGVDEKWGFIGTVI